MNKKSKTAFQLTPEQAEFLSNLIINNKSVIAHSIKAVLTDTFSYLYEECISETYLTACENIDKVYNHENPVGWIIVTAKHTAKRLMKAHWRDLYVYPLDDDIRDDKTDVTEEALYNDYIRNHTQEKLIQLLTDREKEIYNLFYIEHMDANAIGKRLNISPNTVWAVTHNIRNKIINAAKNKK